MRYRFLSLLTVGAACLLSANSSANDIEPTKEFYTATRAGGPVTLDGVLNEWGGVPVLSDPKFSICAGQEGAGRAAEGCGPSGIYVLFERYQGGDWTGPDDHTSAVQVVWDAENVYIGVVVTDEYHENAAASAWNGDSIQLGVTSAARAAAENSSFPLYNFALSGVEGATLDVINQTERGPGGQEVVISRDAARKKTIYEIKLPKAALNLTTLEAGTKFGLGMSINDGDELTPGQKGWGGLGAHAIVYGKDAPQTALITLGAQGPGTDVIFLSAVAGSKDGFSFRATDKGTSIIDPTTAKLTIDGTVVTLTQTAKVDGSIDFRFTPATPYAPDSTHTYSIEIKDTSGATVTDSGSFTVPFYWAAGTFFIEAEDMDFQNGQHMTESDTMPYAGGLYADLVPVLGVDYQDNGTTDVNSNNYRTIEEPNIGMTSNPDTDRGSFTVDPNYKVGWNDAGDWYNYTRNIPSGTYLVYGRFAAGADALPMMRAELSEVTAGRGTAEQTLSSLGKFEAPKTGGWDTFTTVPLKNAVGDPVKVRLSGLRTLRLSQLPDSNWDVNYLALVPTTGAIEASIAAASPANNARVPIDTPINLTLADPDATVPLSSIKLFINGTEATSQATITDTAAGATVVYTPTAFYPVGSTQNVRLEFGGKTFEFQFVATQVNDPLYTESNLFIEAEDFNTAGGDYIPSKGGVPFNARARYNGLGATLDGDYHTADQVDADNYRRGEGPGVNVPMSFVGGAGDGPRTGFNTAIDYKVGWNDADEWYNYTRTFPTPAQDYYVYARLSSGGGPEGATLSRVTGATTTEQTVTELGQFQAPATGNYDIFHFVVLRDASGNPVKVNLGGETTLRFTVQPEKALDFQYLMFAPANQPTILSFSPDTPTRMVVPSLDFSLANVTQSGIRLVVDGTDVTSSTTFTTTAAGLDLKYAPTGGFAGGTHTYSLTLSPTKTVTGSFTSRIGGTGNVFVIEAEDFDYSDGTTSGLANPQKGVAGMDVDVMPYFGGAYDQLPATKGIDFNNNDDVVGQGGDLYRTEADPDPETPNDPDGLNEVAIGSAVNVGGGNGSGGTIPINSSDRISWRVTSNHKIGWTGGGNEWNNYTRTFPAVNATTGVTGKWKVWAALSHGETLANQLTGSLDRVTAGVGTTSQTVERLGSFSAPGSGGWSNSNLVPMKTDTGADAIVDLTGKQTVRFNTVSGDFDFLLFVPHVAATEQPRITSVTRSGNQVTISWTGGGTLWTSPTVTGGTWTSTGDSDGTYTTTASAATAFFQVR